MVTIKSYFSEYKSLDALLDIEKASGHSSERFVKVYLSEQEYQQLYAISLDRKCSLSRIVYEKLYSTSVPIEVTYKTDDIYELITIITDTYRHSMKKLSIRSNKSLDVLLL